MLAVLLGQTALARPGDVWVMLPSGAPEKVLLRFPSVPGYSLRYKKMNEQIIEALVQEAGTSSVKLQSRQREQICLHSDPHSLGMNQAV